MKTALTVSLSLLAGLLYAADTNPTNQVGQAINKLKDQSNYSWSAKVELPEFAPPPQSGKVGKDGIALATQDFGGQEMRAAFKGEKVAVLVEGTWQTVANPDSTDFGDRAAMTARFLTRTGNAVDEAADLLSKVKELKAGEAGLLSGNVTEEGAKELLAFGRRRGAPSLVPPPKDGKGTVKFWLKDGVLVKYQSHLQGKVTLAAGQEPQDWDVTRTVEISDVGTTKVEIPDAAKKIIEAK